MKNGSRAPRLGSSQLSITSGLYRHLHSHAHPHRNTHIKITKNKVDLIKISKDKYIID